MNLFAKKQTLNDLEIKIIWCKTCMASSLATNFKVQAANS